MGGGTPLSWAALNGHEELAKLLLGRKDVNPDTLETGYRTPLSWAAGNGHQDIVELPFIRNWLEWLLTISGNGHESPLASSVKLSVNNPTKPAHPMSYLLVFQTTISFDVSLSLSPRRPSPKMSHYQLASDTRELILSHYQKG